MSSELMKITLYIDNMTCVNCENIIERELSNVPGIESVNASYSSGAAVVTYDGNQISITKMIEVLENNGYHASDKKAEQNKTSRNGNRSAGTQNGKDYTNIVGAAIIIFAVYLIARRLGLFNIFYNFPIAKEGMGYGMIFLIGMLTSVHCVAMCGGICLSQCVPQNNGTNGLMNKFSAMRPSLLYNVGRVISYTIVGGIVGAVGSAVSFSGTMKGFVQIFAGIFMMIMGINMLGVFPWLRKFNPRMPKIFAKKIYAQRNSNSPLYIGLLNGLMPCGPLQAMQLYALSTGSPIRGAVSMFLFSAGTVPLMFAFGALSSLLSKKFTSKMMTASAVLVVILGIFMFNNGMSLSGFMLPSFSSASSSNQTADVASIQDGVQVVTSGLTSGHYEPIVVQKGIPVKWTIKAEDGDINGCNNSIIAQKFGIQKTLEVGDNVIEFTPTESGTFPFSCWMGMIRSKITVVDDLNNIDSSALKDDGTTSTGGGCCAGGGYAGGSSSSSSSGSSSLSGSINYDNLKNARISTDKLAVANVKDGIQYVDITLDKNGFSPAVVVLQSGIETKWVINGDKDSSGSTLIFPDYNASLQVVEGENPIRFVPSQDFTFFTEDGLQLGYVKVVDDINNIDKSAIQKEISEYQYGSANSGL